MSASQYKPWSDNPDAPLITSEQYLWEKSYFAGGLISSILYGISKGSMSPRLPLHAHLILSVYARNAYRAVLQMRGRSL